MPGKTKDQDENVISPAELAAYLSPPKKPGSGVRVSLEKTVDPCVLFEPRELSFIFSNAIEYVWTRKIRLWNLGEGNLHVSSVRCEKDWIEAGKDLHHEALSGFPLEIDVTFRPDRFETDKGSTLLGIAVTREGMLFENIEIPVTAERNDSRVLLYAINERPFAKTLDFGLVPYQDECEFRFRSDEAGKDEKVSLRLEGGSEGETRAEMQAREDYFVKRLGLDDGTYKYSFLTRGRPRKNKLWSASVYGGQAGIEITRDSKKKKVYHLDVRRKQRNLRFENRGTEDLEIELKSSAGWLRMTPLGSESSAWAADRSVRHFRLSPDLPERELLLSLDTSQLDQGENVGEIQVTTNSNLTGQREIKIPVVVDHGYLLPTYRIPRTSFRLSPIHKGRKAQILLDVENHGRARLDVNLKDPPSFLKPTRFSVEGQSDMSHSFVIDTGNLGIGRYDHQIELQTNGYPVEGQKTRFKLDFEVFAYLADVPRLGLGRVQAGRKVSAQVSIKHSHGKETDFAISEDSKYCKDFDFGRVADGEKSRFQVVFTANHQVPPNTVLSDNLELIDRISEERVMLPFEVEIV